MPAVNALWWWVKLFHARTVDLDRRVKDLERDIAVLKDALAANQAMSAADPPQYKA